MRVTFTLNGMSVDDDIADHTLLSDYLREDRGLTGTKVSCGVQVCGACTVLVDGEPVSSCCYLAVEIDQRDVLTIEGLRDLPEYVELEAAFTAHAAAQCGFCTPGFLLTTYNLMSDQSPDDVDGLRDALSGNVCRCTGYRAILDAVAESVGMT